MAPPSNACVPAATVVTLYHQTDGTFKDITKEAGLTRRGWGMGVAVADYDNDGKLDLFVTGFGAARSTTARQLQVRGRH